jgi:heme/copper-type cytochrome/quinol oxidase subunit 2
MRPRRILLTMAGAAALVAVLVPAAAAQHGSGGLRASAMPPQHLAIVIRPGTGRGHDEHVTIPNLAVESGLPVQITFTNFTHASHTFTAPGLRVSALIRPAHGRTPTKTVVTFTAHKYGVFDWTCLICPDTGTGSTEPMRGKIYSIIQA